MSKYALRNDAGDHRILKDDPRAIAVLKDEHHIFRTLFDAGNDASGAALVKIAGEICMRLTVHMTIEEQLLYPAGKQIGDAEEVDEGIVEHAAGKQLIAEIEAMQGTEELFKSKVHVLGEQTVHHIDEEDEDLFEELKKAHSDGKIDLDAIGDAIVARQAELYGKAASGETLAPLTEQEALTASE